MKVPLDGSMASILFLYNARAMEDEALSTIRSPLARHRVTGSLPEKQLPSMTEAEIIAQARRFRAVTWVEARDGSFHKVGLTLKTGRLAFSHHTMKDLRRQLCFEELGGEACHCVDFLHLFEPTNVWMSLPPHFRRELNKAFDKRRERSSTGIAKVITVKPSGAVGGQTANLVPVLPAKQWRHQSRSQTRVMGWRVRYDGES